jgi:hypothetical protein
VDLDNGACVDASVFRKKFGQKSVGAARALDLDRITSSVTPFLDASQRTPARPFQSPHSR